MTLLLSNEDVDGGWLVPGQHVNSVQSHELDLATLERATVIVVRSRDAATFHYPAGQAPVEARKAKRLHCMKKALGIVWGVWHSGRDFDPSLDRA